MKINNVEIMDTYAEAWVLEVVRLVVTAVSEELALEGAHQFIGAAGSGELGSKISAGIERVAFPPETPDGRPGVIICLTNIPSARKQLLDELSLRFLLASLVPTIAVFDYMVPGVPKDEVDILDAMISSLTDESASDLSKDNAAKLTSDSWDEMYKTRSLYAVPTLTGVFRFEKHISIATNGCDGHFVCYAKDSNAAVLGVSAAKAAMKVVAGACPMGIGLEQVYREKDYVVALRDKIKDTKVPEDTGSILNLLIFGVEPDRIANAMSHAIRAACQVPGVIRIGAMNFGGTFGPHKFPLHDIMKLSE